MSTTSKAPKVYVCHTDSGHGWLAVKRAELVELGIADKITSYSYVRGATVYLDEDCDAATFIEARKARGLETPMRSGAWREVSPIRRYARYTTERSPVRSYSRYSVGGGL
jgi:hypothetical protein